MTKEQKEHSSMKKRNISKIFEQSIYFVLTVVAAFFIIVSIAEPWIYHDVNGFLTIILATVFCIIFYYGLSFVQKLSVQGINAFIWIGICIAFCIQMYIAFHMQLMPKVDLSHIYNQCLTMLEEGTSQITDHKYFGFNTNNIPVTIVLYHVFRLSRAIGLTNYRLAGGIFNVLLLLIVYSLLFQILKKITTLQTAAAIMFLLLTNPAFYAYASYYYTDTISLAFTVVSAYFMICGVFACRKKKCLFFPLSGFFMGLAYQVRVTSIFLIIAVSLCLLVKKHWRHLIQCGSLFAIGFLAFTLLWQPLYTYHVDFDTTNSSTTVEHFLMMGSAQKGTYNKTDVKFTQSFDTHEEKVKNNLSVYKQRIKENGIWGNLRLAVTKEAIVWGIGSRGYQQYTQHVAEKTPCYDYISGDKSAGFKAWMQAYNIVLFLMILLGVLNAKKEDEISMFILSVYWGGALLFYLFWEAHPRHALSFLPFLTMLAIPGIRNYKLFRNRYSGTSKEELLSDT